MRSLLFLVLVAASAGGGCGRGSRGGPPPEERATPPAGLSLGDVRLLDPDGDERMAPSFGRGEQLRLALAPHPLAPPLAAVVRLVRPDGTLLHRDEPRKVTRGAAVNAPWSVPFAVPLEAPPGRYRVEAAITDGRGQSAVAHARLEYVTDAPAPGAGPSSRPAAASSQLDAGRPAGPSGLTPGYRSPHGCFGVLDAGLPSLRAVRLRDAADLPRARFARGEKATVEVEVAGARPGDALRLRLVGPDGVHLEREGVVPVEARAPAVAPTVVRQPVRLPRYGAPGAYRLVAVVTRGRKVVQAEAPLELVGRPLPTPEGFEIEASTVAGQTGRRVAVVEGGRARIRVRLAGFTVRPAGAGWEVGLRAVAVLRLPDGRPLSRTLPVGALEETLPYRATRVDLEGDVDLPRAHPGDFLLELQAQDVLGAVRATALRHVSIP